MKSIVIILSIIVLFLSTALAQNLEEYWSTDFSGGIRPDLSPAMMPDNAMIELHNGVIEGMSIVLRPGYSLWAQGIDTLTDGTSPKAVDDAVYGVRGLYEFYNDITGETQVLAVINDEVWWIADDSTNWHRVSLSAGTATATQNDSIVIGASVDWWPRMLPQNGDDWTLHIADSAEGVYRVIGNKILLDGQWKPTTASGAKYELTPVFDSTKNIHFTTVNQTCFISDGTRPVVQWSNHTIDNGYYIIDSATVDTIGGPAEHKHFVSFSTGLTLDLVDSAGDYSANDNALAIIDTLKDSTKVHICPIIWHADNSNKLLWIMIADRDTNFTLENNVAYIVRPLSGGWNFEPDTVYSGTIDALNAQGGGNLLMYDTSQTWGLDEFNSGVYEIIAYDTAHDTRFAFASTKFYAAAIDTDFGGGNKTYTALQITTNDTPQGNAVTVGDAYDIIKYTYFPHAHFTQWRQARMWYLASPVYPNVAWYSEMVGAAGLNTTNYYDDVSTINYETIGAGDGDEIMGVSKMQQWIIPYKRHHIYAIGGTPPLFDVYLKSSNYGLWSDGFSMPYMETDFGLNRLGVFAFNGAQVMDHKQVSAEVAPFFIDSLNLSEMDLVRGELYDDYILFSFPDASNTKNTKTLVLDTKTGAWSTWGFAAASYLTRRAPGSLDTLLWGATDSAAIFVMGGTTDAGTEIELSYKSPFFDFGDASWKKQLRKVYVTGQFNVLCSLRVHVYTDSLHDAAYTDSILCSSLLGYETPQDRYFEFPTSIEDATRISIKLESMNADSLRIDKIGYAYKKTRKVGAQ
jgi:hypothetical protein